jgi:tetratricopeptide (TPR) repeat protein
VKSYERALYLIPAFVDARFHMAKALVKLQRYPESIDQYHRILQADPKNYRAHNDLASLFIMMSQFDRAVSHCRQALSLKPDFNEAKTNLKLALERVGAEPGKSSDPSITAPR